VKSYIVLLCGDWGVVVGMPPKLKKKAVEIAVAKLGEFTG